MSKCVMYRVSCITLLLLLMVQSVWSHGGGLLQVASEPTGPYLVSVWTSPTRLEADNPVHVTVGVAGKDEAPILDAAVMVEITFVETGERWSAAATTEQSTNKLFYEADMRLRGNGRYNMTIQIEGPQGIGATTFALEVLPQSQTNWLMLGFIGLGIMLSMLMFRLWEKQPTSAPTRKR